MRQNGVETMPRGDRLTRLLKMILVIQSHPGLSAEELAERCNVSVRQCYRDLSILQYAGVPVYHDHGYMLPGFKLKNISFNLEEALALIYGLKLMERQRGTVFQTSGIKEKLLSVLPERLRSEIEELGQRVEVPVGPGADYTGKEEIFKKLNDAVRKHEILQIEYYSFSRDEITEREVEPYQLVFNDGFWYLVGYCHHREDTRLFRVDRIRKMEPTGKHFVLPDNFDFESYMGAAWQMERGEEFCFRVRFFGGAARFVRETQFHPSQLVEEKADGSIIFTAKACGMRSVMRWVLTFGAEAEVIEPPELRTMIKGELKEGVKRYT